MGTENAEGDGNQMKLDQATIDALIAAGATIGPAVKLPVLEDETVKQKRKHKPKVIENRFQLTETGPMWEIGIQAVSEANTRSKWGSTARVAHQRKAIQRELARHIGALVYTCHRIHWMGHGVKVRITRIAPGTLDVGNLWRALKAVEDAVSLYLGIEDRPPLWDCAVEQEKNAAYGVRIEILT